MLRPTYGRQEQVSEGGHLGGWQVVVHLATASHHVALLTLAAGRAWVSAVGDRFSTVLSGLCFQWYCWVSVFNGTVSSLFSMVLLGICLHWYCWVSVFNGSLRSLFSMVPLGLFSTVPLGLYFQLCCSVPVFSGTVGSLFSTVLLGFCFQRYS